MPDNKMDKDPDTVRQQNTAELEAQLKRYTDDIVRLRELLNKETLKRKTAEQALKTIEQEKIGIFNSMAEHVIYHDKNMKIIWANHAAASSIGMTSEQLVGLNCYELWQNRDTICENCPVVRALETGESHTIETSSPDGRSWFIHGYPVKNEKGAVIGAAEVTMDLTVIKQAERALEESEKRLRMIFDSANDAMFIHDLQGNFLEVNRTACARLGYAWDELLKMKVMDIDASEYAGLVLKRIDALRKNGPKFFETAHVTKDKKMIPIELSSRIIEYQGKPAVLSIARDISKRKQAEIAQRESERRYRTLIDAIPGGVIVCDPEGTMIFVSEQICSLTGYTYEDLVGKVGLFLVHDDDKEIVRENLQKVLTSDLGPAEYRLVKPDGQIYSVEVNPVILEDDQGNPKNIVLSVRDISERKHSEKALRESENLFRSVVETSHAGIVIVDNAFHMTYVNDELCCIIDRPRDELIGHDFREFLDKESQELVADRYIRRQKGENIEPRYEFNLFRKNGEKRRVEISTAVIKDSNDKPVSISQILDVTGRKKAELNLRQSEEKYKTLTENVNVGIYRNTADSKGKFIEVNSALVRMFGHENKEDFLKLDVSELYQIPSDRKKFNEKMVEYGFVKDEILQLKKKDGTPFFASVSAVAVKDDKGNILYYDGIIDDITDRIRAEQDLKNSYTRLKKVLNGTVSALASTTEKRDPYTAGHQHRVTQLAAAIAQEMGFSSDRIDGIKVAGIVHDIGKIHVAAEILNKPVALNDIEMELVKTHCQAGYEILKTIDFPWDVAEIVLQHHERINGSGYPRGLTGEQIMLEAKIIAVADVVEAMVSHRPYRAALSTDMALEEISSNRGVLFDDEIVEICLKLFGQGFEFK